ncbi:patatin-like phospholipase family protein [Nitrincola alkalisediminis]|uniref:patatin-like phospholipase family protein n=1 Tax=Nitrincola alkalisediminis TaxID=1366656 RepID=UPI0018753866|nr:patatin-like phospholipase family protein [Nitrincola alkalisediminis]
MKVGIALGSGASRGWSHIGILRALHEEGITPEIVCGTSIGALVGAAYATDHLDKLEDWVLKLTKLKLAQFFEINTSLNGFVNRDRLVELLDGHVAPKQCNIEDLPKQFASITTDLESGRELWITEGSVLDAVWCSIALPGLFPAVKYQNKWVVDGGLVNPVPVSTCRALGADVVIAVNLNGDLLTRPQPKPVQNAKASTRSSKASPVSKITELVNYAGAVFSSKEDTEEAAPSMFDVIAGSVNITQDRITRSRMAGDPPDILLSPRLANIGLLEFYRAEEAIDEGRACVKRMLPALQHALGL